MIFIVCLLLYVLYIYLQYKPRYDQLGDPYPYRIVSVYPRCDCERTTKQLKRERERVGVGNWIVFDVRRKEPNRTEQEGASIASHRMATLNVPSFPPVPKDDAIRLYTAFKGFGCDTSAVINIIAHRDATQRGYIQHEYRTMYSDDLLKRLSSELSGKLETAVLLWMPDPAARDAIILKQSLTVAKNLEAATEVICSRTPSQLQYLRQIYHSKFGVYLEHDIERHASGDHKKILLAYVNTPRHEGPEVHREMAEKDAKVLYEAGEKKLGTDEKTFVQIFSERSAAHLAAVSYYYRSMCGHSLKKAVKNETSGNFAHALLTIVQCAENPAKYFAKVLRKAMKGLGTNDSTLIRVIVTRAEIDLQYIKAEYLKKYKKTLNDAVHSETSGHYRAFLLSLLGPN